MREIWRQYQVEFLFESFSKSVISTRAIPYQLLKHCERKVNIYSELKHTLVDLKIHLISPKTLRI
jgi:hypothetical protein